jgi:hypothetical protein
MINKMICEYEQLKGEQKRAGTYLARNGYI